MKLTDTACRAAKPASKPYKLTDGAGLYLLVRPTGGKSWQMKYTAHGKAKTLSFGVYPIVSLAEARQAREAAKRLLAKGIDPSEAKKQDKRQSIRNAQNTFKATALEWHAVKKEKWAEHYAQDVLHKMERDLFPILGNIPLGEISPSDVLNVLRKIEDRGAIDIARRAKHISGQVFRYGMQLDRCKGNPVDALKTALKSRKTKHFAAIDPKELPELLKAIERNDARLFRRTRNALWLSLYTFLRPGEIRKATWSEFDFENSLWTIPAAKMKMQRDHNIPLSKQAIRVLKDQKEESGMLNSDLVFPSQINPKQPMSDGTVRIALHNLGFKDRMTAHGFRALARTAIRERLDYPPDVIEAQLAHKPAGPLGAAYARSDFLTQRKTMMQDWADYLDTVASGGQIIHANFKKTMKGTN